MSSIENRIDQRKRPHTSVTSENEDGASVKRNRGDAMAPFRDPWLKEAGLTRDDAFLREVRGCKDREWHHAGWGKESECATLHASEQFPDNLNAPEGANLPVFPVAPCLLRFPQLVVFPEYQELWRDIQLWLTHRIYNFAVGERPDALKAPSDFDIERPAWVTQHPMAKHLALKSFIILGTSGSGARVVCE
jgi:hypothetical protein